MRFDFLTETELLLAKIKMNRKLITEYYEGFRELVKEINYTMKAMILTNLLSIYAS